MNDHRDRESSVFALLTRAALSALARLVLVLVFFVFFLPLGWIMRMLGGDPLRRRIEPSAKSYYESSRQRPRDHMDKPF